MRRILIALLFTLVAFGGAAAQPTADEPVVIAIFPLKNLYWEVKYDSLSWAYADSLYNYLNSRPNAGKLYTLIPMDDLRDQMIALNIDPRAPAYETDIWKVVKLLGAKKVVWGTYLVKYEKANIELVIIDAKTVMKDRVNIADKVRSLYVDALTTVVTAADKIYPGLKP